MDGISRAPVELISVCRILHDYHFSAREEVSVGISIKIWFGQIFLCDIACSKSLILANYVEFWVVTKLYQIIFTILEIFMMAKSPLFSG